MFAKLKVLILKIHKIWIALYFESKCVNILGNFAKVTNISFGFLFFPVAYIIHCLIAALNTPSWVYCRHSGRHHPISTVFFLGSVVDVC
ncbi:hypothetical protein BDA96_05G094600 [Sorghum bicolor]|uniref:Uncharacterized protein n=1 Tax=Sorghum bicolor TaxID=4558 RepID=A0A921QVX3_SORBI|nr:hypothetical protein BDA96_05G094600 [Sorghum bicolor]